ncbi:MAG: methionine--tRNA ligase [Rickettsia sp.]|nr:methionine--tRNA ligase [Rickettsia sp.]
MNNFFLTTPIYYVNDKPHIGHAYTNIISDVIARIMKFSEYNSFLLTGTDEHGSKIESAAFKTKQSVESFVETNSKFFHNLLNLLNIDHNQFLRTTEKNHKNKVIDLWNILLNSGNIYLGKYKGWYVKKDEAFYTEKELENLKIPTNSPDVEWLEEESYFFKLSHWQDKLLEFYDKNPNFIIPYKHRKEVVNFVKNGLDDLSISRKNVNWGIKAPNSDHVIYVWLDALSSYLSPSSHNKNLWPCDLHVIGKDILKFHAIYWPAFLMAANIELPKSLLVHGWWKNEGQKISKSLGNVIDPVKLVDELGVDVVRYVLVRMLNIGNDGNFVKKTVISINNSELVNKIGNLVHRASHFLFVNLNGEVPNFDSHQIQELYQKGELLQILDKNIVNWIKIVKTKNFQLNEMLEIILHITEKANVFFENSQIWKKKDKPEEMKKILYQTLETIRYVAILLQAFIPNSANKILNQIAVPKNQRSYSHLNSKFHLLGNSKILAPEVIFKKL